MSFVLVHAFAPSATGHGGNKRSQQVRDTFRRLGTVTATEVFAQPNFGSGALRILNLLLKGYLWQFRFRLFALDPKVAVLVGAAAAFAERLVRENGRDFTLVWEGSVSANWFLGAVAKAMGLRVIAVPHNVDSLVAGIRQPFFRARQHWLEFEMSLYRDCDLVLGIAHEDVWLLRLYGANAQWWPYETHASADAVRRAESGGYCLSFGTALNAPTAAGLRAVSKAFRRFLPEVPLKLAGRGTEAFRSDPDFAGIECFGEVNEAQLGDLIRGAACVVVHQPPATGALTRLVDLEEYGVPVLCNVDAYRSAQFLAHAACYTSETELAELVRRILGGEILGGRTDALDRQRIGPVVAAVTGSDVVAAGEPAGLSATS